MTLALPIGLLLAGLILAWVAACRIAPARKGTGAGSPPARSPTRPIPHPVKPFPPPPEEALLRGSQAGGVHPASDPAGLDLGLLQPAPPMPAHLQISDPPENVPDTVPEFAYRIGEQVRARRALLEILGRPSFDPKELSDFAMGDPALAGEILRAVNSPYYGFQTKIASIFRAVLLLGHIEVRNIVWRTCLHGPPGSPSDERLQLCQESLWRHAFETSRLAYAIARCCGVRNPDSLATAALLHDVGKIIHLGIGAEGAADLYQDSGFSSDLVLATEARSFGIDHAGRGGQAASVWGLPEATTAAIRHHHAPSYLDPSQIPSHQQPVAIVHLADLLTHLASPGTGASPPPPVYQPREGWCELLGLRGIEELARLEPVARGIRARGGAAA